MSTPPGLPPSAISDALYDGLMIWRLRLGAEHPAAAHLDDVIVPMILALACRPAVEAGFAAGRDVIGALEILVENLRRMREAGLIP